MMYRASPGARTARKSNNDGALMRAALGGHMGLDALPSVLASQVRDIMARRERQRVRHVKRWTKHHNYHGHGMNGPRAVARRLRQIAAGQLQVPA